MKAKLAVSGTYVKLDKSHYATLQLSPKASKEEIRASYRRLILVHHPDRDGDRQIAEALNAAWEVLGDAARRQTYDAELASNLQNTPAAACHHVLIADDAACEVLKGPTSSSTSVTSPRAISQTVSLAEFFTNNGSNEYRFPSRCGQEFMVDNDQLEQADGELILSCDSCSETIRVIYEIQEEPLYKENLDG
ncbi:MAG: hypothetical protein CYPHOPRED_004007 [Cyphobasidiales sp. Tagirdzhanova-0007]|nr:MAG: hypothetical protein CYPHOPRED_004007 [Cyphobasidiales sp. Tagirdzhanova-0007]